MYHLHLTRNLRSITFLVLMAALLALPALLWWANHTGMPESWRATIEKEISKHGAYVKIGSLSYIPFKGLIASDIRIFSDPEQQKQISTLQNMILDFDKTKLSRGEVKLIKVAFTNASLSIPVDPDNPDSENLEVTKAFGTLFLPGNRRFEVRNARGTVAGISITLDARIIGYKANPNHKPDPSGDLHRRQLIADILREINGWGFDRDHPPQLRATLTGDVNDPNTLEANLQITSKSIGKNQHSLEDVSVDAEVRGSVLTLTEIEARDSRGSLHAKADYDITAKSGRFEAVSSLQLNPILHDWFGTTPSSTLTITGNQHIDAQGNFRIFPNQKPEIEATGHISLGGLSIKGIHFDSLDSAFSWRNEASSWKNSELFLRDITLKHPEGLITGKTLVQWPLVRMAVHSTTPGSVWKPLFTGQPLENVIADFSSHKNASYDISLEGGFDATDHFSWAYTGGGTVKNVSYKGVPVNSADCRFSLSHHELDFYDGTIDFNYQDYPMRKAFSGPNQAIAKVGRIRYDASSKLVEVEDVTGSIWAAPMVRLFAPKVADSLEIYRFHHPPELKGSGVVDVTPQGRTSLDISFRSKHAATYPLLGKDTVLTQPSGKVSIRNNRVIVDQLELDAFKGPVKARIDYQAPGKLDVDVSFTRFSLQELADTYDFQIKGGGSATGRTHFTIQNGNIETVEGSGLLALEKTELFSVPMFGPLSPLISGVLADRRAGFERAKNAFCNYTIHKGILSTSDFQTATNSLTFLGDGSLDLKERTIDMTIRMNARGLLGLITLPLKPFYGMFQFRGTGPWKATQWENVMFTSPPKEQRDLLMDPPKAKIIQE